MLLRLRETWGDRPPGAVLEIGRGAGELLVLRGVAEEVAPKKAAPPAPQKPNPPRGQQLPRGQR